MSLPLASSSAQLRYGLLDSALGIPCLSKKQLAQETMSSMLSILFKPMLSAVRALVWNAPPNPISSTKVLGGTSLSRRSGV